MPPSGGAINGSLHPFRLHPIPPGFHRELVARDTPSPWRAKRWAIVSRRLPSASRSTRDYAAQHHVLGLLAPHLRDRQLLERHADRARADRLGSAALSSSASSAASTNTCVSGVTGSSLRNGSTSAQWNSSSASSRWSVPASGRSATRTRALLSPTRIWARSS